VLDGFLLRKKDFFKEIFEKKKLKNLFFFFCICTVHLDIIKVLFIHQLMD